MVPAGTPWPLRDPAWTAANDPEATSRAANAAPIAPLAPKTTASCWVRTVAMGRCLPELARPGYLPKEEAGPALLTTRCKLMLARDEMPRQRVQACILACTKRANVQQPQLKTNENPELVDKVHPQNGGARRFKERKGSW
jgi:hypothetical protein